VDVLIYISVCLLGYLIGSIPAGYLIGRCAGVDIRREGSGNIGATNVLRVLGKPYGYGVFLFDFFKGVIAVRLAILTVSYVHAGNGQANLIGIISGVLCVLGHTYPVWLGFKGGKGVATSAGVLFGLMPMAAAAVMFFWLVVFQITKYVSIASIAAALALPIAAFAVVHWKQTNEMVLVYFSICLTFVVVWRHRSNLDRLRKGTEHSFRRK
jgi:glycerol-3-phosphate acyltransferase PlsY